MDSQPHPIILVTRGSALALVQTRAILAECRAAFPNLTFEYKTVKTTGDKLQRAAHDPAARAPEKGLFTKELEVELLNGTAHLAIHSLKDLPTELPKGLKLGAVSKRADARDVLIYRDARPLAADSHASSPGRGLGPHATPNDLPDGAVIGTGSTRRQAQLTAVRKDFKFSPIRGNVGTRLKKLAAQPELDGLVLAAAGLNRLHFHIQPDGSLTCDSKDENGTPLAPSGLLASYLPFDTMLPCAGQAAIGIEVRTDDELAAKVCDRLNHPTTFRCVEAERAFLAAMGGGCLSPIAAYAEIVDETIRLRAVSFANGESRAGTEEGPALHGVALAQALARELRV